MKLNAHGKISESNKSVRISWNAKSFAFTVIEETYLRSLLQNQRSRLSGNRTGSGKFLCPGKTTFSSSPTQQSHLKVIWGNSVPFWVWNPPEGISSICISVNFLTQCGKSISPPNCKSFFLFKILLKLCPSSL